MMGAYLIGIIVMVVSLYVSWRLKSKFKKYSKIHLQNGMSGCEIAEKMLKDHNIYDVQVVSTKGHLTDHYDPSNKTVNLSDQVYNGRNAAAAAVASHECGHAVQHATEYAWLHFRSQIVPFVSVTSRFMHWVILGGILLINAFPALLLIGIILFAVTTIFSFITLPVEFDASNRALAWIKHTKVVNDQEYEASKDALKWAALTYVVAALGTLATLLYYVSIYMGRRD